MGVKVQVAQHVGRTHMIGHKNLQDALCVWETSDCVIGVICDGCSGGEKNESGGRHSEAGAAMASNFLVSTLKMYRESYPEATPHWLAMHVEEELKYFLRKMIQPFAWAHDNHSPERVDYVQNYLLFTVVGFIWTPEQTCFFWVGDGTLMYDDVVEYLNVGDTPTYAGYWLVPDSLQEGKPEPFVNLITRDQPHPQRIAIGSDAWKDERDVVIFDGEPIQRKLNRLSHKEHRFGDDVSLIVLEVE